MGVINSTKVINSIMGVINSKKVINSIMGVINSTTVINSIMGEDRCCRKPMKGATPVPGAIMRRGVRREAGWWKRVGGRR